MATNDISRAWAKQPNALVQVRHFMFEVVAQLDNRPTLGRMQAQVLLNPGHLSERIARLRRVQWNVLPLPSGTLILGDFGPIEYGSNPGFRVSNTPADLILLPISHSVLLYGYDEGIGPPERLDPEEVNLLSARGSHELFIAQKNTRRETNYYKDLGVMNQVADDQEVGRIVEQHLPYIWGDLQIPDVP